MLIQFTVGNYRSIREEVTLNMTAVKHIKEFADENMFIAGRYSLLKSAVLYGANASGKSNVFNALGFFKWFTINSFKETQLDDEIDVTPFKLHTDYQDKPSSFEGSFLIDGIKYRYGYEVDRKRVRTEWLLKADKTKEQPLFVRDQDEIEVYKGFVEGEHLEGKTRDNALFLSVVSQFNGKISGDIIKWFKGFNIISGLTDRNYEGFTADLINDNNKSAKEFLVRQIKDADLGISNIEVDKTEISKGNMPDNLPEEVGTMILEELKDRKGVMYSITTLHDIYSAEGNTTDTARFNFESEESEGTKKYFRLTGPILDTLVRGQVLVIDELDARLHPLLTQQIVQLFNSSETNPNNAQLIFATHDTNLLSACTFRRDQIWFVEKDRTGGSDLYSLAEYKLPKGKVRKDASFEQDYIKGRYGAIPFLGDFKALSTLTHGQKEED